MVQTLKMLLIPGLILLIFSCSNNNPTSSNSNTPLKDQENMAVSREASDPEEEENTTESPAEATAEQVNSNAATQPAQLRFM